MEETLDVLKHLNYVGSNPNLRLSLYEAFPLWKKVCMYYQEEQPLPVFQHFVICLKKKEGSWYSYTIARGDPLAQMILDEDVEFVMLLIGSPVNFTAITDPWSGDVGNALHFAARRLKNKMIDLLLEHSMDIGIDFNDRNDLGETALHIIAKRKTCTPCVQNIPNIQCSVQLCLKRLLDYAVARNIGVNIKNSRGQTPFEVMLKGHACVLWMDYDMPFELDLFEKICINDLRNLVVKLFKDMKEKGQNIEEAEQMLCKTNRLYKTRLAGFSKPQLAAVVVELYRVRKEEHLKAKLAKKKHKVETEGSDVPKKKQKV